VNSDDWRRQLAKLLAAGKLVSDEQAKRVTRTVLPKNIAKHSTIEQLVRREQNELAGVVGDAVALLRNGPSEAAKAALFERAGKLSPSALMTAKALIKARLEHLKRPR
jgi:hypothetical protein